MKITKLLVGALLLSSFSALSADNAEIQQLKVQVQALTKAFKQLQTNQVAIAKKVGLLNDKKLVPGDKVSLSGASLVGDEAAEIVIMEFTDLQCPYCQKFQLETYPLLKEKYIDSGKVLFANRQNPISTHPQAFDAAKQLLCAAEQGKFSEAKKGIFEKGDLVKQLKFNEIPGLVGLDEEKLNACLTGKVNSQIKADLALSQRLAVNTTPSFFIGLKRGDTMVDWQKIEGAKPYDVFEKTIESLLSK